MWGGAGAAGLAPQLYWAPAVGADACQAAAGSHGESPSARALPRLTEAVGVTAVVTCSDGRQAVQWGISQCPPAGVWLRGHQVRPPPCSAAVRVQRCPLLFPCQVNPKTKQTPSLTSVEALVVVPRAPAVFMRKADVAPSSCARCRLRARGGLGRGDWDVGRRRRWEALGRGGGAALG